jgi:hypothetical protein
MSGPWDDYKPQTQASSGPWSDYAPQQPQITPSSVPGVPDRPNIDWSQVAPPDNKSGFQKFLDNYNLSGPLFNHQGDDSSSWWQKAKDMDQALGNSAMGLLDFPMAALNQIPEDLFGKNFVSNRLEEHQHLSDNANPQQQAYEQNIGDIMNSMDPGHLAELHPYEDVPQVKKGVEPVKAIPKAEVPDGPWKQYAHQDELPFTNNVEDIAHQQNAQGSQMDLFHDNQPEAPVPYNAQDIQSQDIANQQAQMDFWKQRAENIQQQQMEQQRPGTISINTEGNAADPATMEALGRSTEGITYENVPPDGVIPRDANRLPNGEPMLRVPRGNEWQTDENGIPVRQGLPESTVAPDYINRYMRQDEGARNDLGNAIQEANGPKLGPDEAYGAGPLDQPRIYRNSQRGSVDGDLLNSAVQKVKDWFTGSPEAGRTRSYSLEEQAARKNAELQFAGPGQYITQDRDLAGVYGGPNGRAYQVHEPFSKPFDFNSYRTLSNGTKIAGDKLYKNLVEKTGSKAAANAELRKQGFDAITFTSPRGEKIANIFEPRNLTDIGAAREPVKDLGELSLVPKEIGTQSDKFNVELARAMRGRGSQAGIIDGKLIEATHDLVKKAASSFFDLASKPVRSIIGMLPEDHMARVSGEDMVYKPRPGADFAKDAVAEGQKDPHFFKLAQSGPLHTAEKPGVNSNALRGVGSWLQWADKRTHLDNRERVNPIQGAIRKLSDDDMVALSKHMIDEQRNNTRQDPSGLSDRAQKAYKMMRDEFDKSYNQTVKRAVAKGKEPPTREEAYHASIRQGDFSQSFFAKSGQLIARVSSGSKLEALKADAYFRKNHPDLDWNKSGSINYAPDFKGINVPRDVLGAYQEMLKFFDGKDPTVALINDTVSKYLDEKGFSTKGFDQRLMDKKNIRGFEGDKPWLSDKENARSFFSSQVKYLRDANHWNNFQEALDQIDPIMKNEDLVKNQPRIMDYAKSLVQRELGISSNVLERIEKEWAKNFPKVGFVDGKLTVAQGISRGNLYKGVSDLKTGTYLTMLGANIPYMITTPIQAALSIPRHMMLSSQGFEHNALNTVINTMRDVGAGLARHTMSSMTGKDVNIPISDIGKRMLQYAENNGILDKTILDETGSIHGHAIAEAAKKTIGMTITAPEKLARYSTFVSFAHHLMDAGLTEADAFQKAERMTNDSLTSMRKLDKPLLVDKFGAGGQLGYVFKSYLFNYYNQMAEYAGHAKRGNMAPLAAFVGLSFLMGGALSLPGVNEADGFYSMFKNLVAAKFPQFYHDDLGIKGTLIKDLPTWASMGALSGATGTNIGSRFNTQITNPENPLGDIAVPIQEIKEASTALNWAADPTERHAIQAVHANMGSTLKGQMETRMDAFKNPNPETSDGRDENGRMAYRKASDINDVATDYKRTPSEETKRSLGFYSEDEYKTKQLRYINNTEESRVMDAYTTLMNKAITKGVDGDTAAASRLASAALRLVPDSNKFDEMIEAAAIKHGATPEERMAMKANAIENLQKLMRLSNGQSATP